MKIAINGEIIDTENIYKIDNKVIEMYNGLSITNLGFTITYFNNHQLKIKLSLPIHMDSDKTIVKPIYEGDVLETVEIIKREATLKDFRQMSEYIEIYNKVEGFRKSIVEIWANNQSTIPQFNLE